MQIKFGDQRIAARYWTKVKINETTQCWEFQGETPWGYGRVYVRGRKGQTSAHRYWYECLVGPIRHGLVIDHRCRVRSCVNPAHLEAVTPSENSRRSPLVMKMIEEGAERSRSKTHCPKGHPYEGKNLKKSNASDGPRRTCRECATKACRTYYANNAERMRARGREYHAANRDARRAQMRAAYHKRKKAKPPASE